MCAFNWSHLGKCFTTAIPWNYNPEWSTLDIVSWNCMIEPEPGHSSHSFHCPSQVGVWGQIAIRWLYTICPDHPPHTSPSLKKQPRQTKICMTRIQMKRRRRRRWGVEEEEKKIRTVVELSVQPQALAPLLVRVLAHKTPAYSSRSVT